MQRVRIENKTPEPANRWFEKRRDFHIRSLYRGFFKTYATFVTLYQGYIADGKINFDELVHLVGTEVHKGRLWQLKDHCHRLFQENSQQNGLLLDWVIGSVFHEAMKLKENIYMYQFYGPAGPTLEGNGSTDPSLHCGVSRKNFMRGIIREARRQVDNLSFLFNRANFLLRMLLPSQGQNVLLLRLLLEKPEISQEMWSESVEQLFAELFPHQPETGYLLIAKSYFDGLWLNEALASYEAALTLNADLEEARRRTFLIRTMINDRQKIMAANIHH
ncbi:MAG: hypothetical protein ABFS09_00285 [Thermodesulfobacteriota bacterium]